MPSREPLRRSEADLSNLDIIDSIAYAIQEQSYEMDKTAGMKEKLLKMIGAEPRSSAASKVGKGALAAGAGAGVGVGVGSKYHKELEDLLTKIKKEGGFAIEKAKHLFQKHIYDAHPDITKAMKERSSSIYDGIPSKADQIKDEITQALKKMHSFKEG